MFKLNAKWIFTPHHYPAGLFFQLTHPKHETYQPYICIFPVHSVIWVIKLWDELWVCSSLNIFNMYGCVRLNAKIWLPPKFTSRMITMLFRWVFLDLRGCSAWLTGTQICKLWLKTIIGRMWMVLTCPQSEKQLICVIVFISVKGPVHPHRRSHLSWLNLCSGWCLTELSGGWYKQDIIRQCHFPYVGMCSFLK